LIFKDYSCVVKSGWKIKNKHQSSACHPCVILLTQSVFIFPDKLSLESRLAKKQGGITMSFNQLNNQERMEMLKWVSERNLHMPISELAFMFDINDDFISDSNIDDEEFEAALA